MACKTAIARPALSIPQSQPDQHAVTYAALGFANSSMCCSPLRAKFCQSETPSSRSRLPTLVYRARARLGAANGHYQVGTLEVLRYCIRVQDHGLSMRKFRPPGRAPSVLPPSPPAMIPVQLRAAGGEALNDRHQVLHHLLLRGQAFRVEHKYLATVTLSKSRPCQRSL
jgi:hypothetical protein